MLDLYDKIKNSTCVVVEANNLDEAMDKLKDIKPLITSVAIKPSCHDKRCDEVPGHCHCRNLVSPCQAQKLRHSRTLVPPQARVTPNARYKVIINEPAVILLDELTRKKYVSKAHDLDEFNPEVGLMMCFTKMAGMNYHKLEELLANATVIQKETPHEEEVRELPKRAVRKVYAVQINPHTYLSNITYREGRKSKVKLSEVPYLFNRKKDAKKAIEDAELKEATIVAIDPTTMEEVL